MVLQLHCCEGLKTASQVTSLSRRKLSPFTSLRIQHGRETPAFQVVAQKRVKKVQQVVLTAKGAQAGLGSIGQITKVPHGYFRNYLEPQRLALPATQGILQNILKQEQNEAKAAQQVQAKAQAMATALQTIGKFTVKKKSGAADSIFGSVTTQDIVEAIAAQTGRTLDKKMVDLPDIKKLGTYDVSVRLHPNVTGKFKVVVQKQKEQR